MSWGFCGDVQSGLLMGTVRGTYGTGLALVARLGPICRRGRRGCLRGRRGTWRHRPSLCVAGVALGDIDLHFAWQLWHLWHWTGSGGTHTQLFHTTLSHTTLSHTTLSHASLSHTIFYTTLSRTTVSHTTLLHTQTYTHTTLSHTALSPNLSCTISFPSCLSISFSHLLVIIGRSWFVGLSGPLIVSTHKNGDDLWMVTMAWGESRVHHTSHDYLIIISHLTIGFPETMGNLGMILGESHIGGASRLVVLQGDDATDLRPCALDVHQEPWKFFRPKKWHLICLCLLKWTFKVVFRYNRNQQWK